jgi:Fe-S-cluster-containing dehydrogenase component
VKKWNWIIDVEKCEDCNNCFISCKDEFVDNDFPKYSASQPKHGHRWINIMRKERGQYPLIDVAYLPRPCMHCDNAPCIKAAKKETIIKRNDGIVLIDPEKAIGQKDIVNACPYDAIWWNEEKNIPQKCSFCAHLLDQGWKAPRCVQACPTGAMTVVYTEDVELLKRTESEKLENFCPDYKTSPRVYYKNLYRFVKCFIRGSVATEENGVIDCAEGSDVSLIKDGISIAKTITDNFGDFEFDNLDENSGEYNIEILFKEKKKILTVDLKTSTSLQTICI